MTVQITGDGVVSSTSGHMDFSNVIRLDSQTLSSVTIPANRNCGMFGPTITISGTLTVPSTSAFTVIG
jgi:hypothetical protein